MKYPKPEGKDLNEVDRSLAEILVEKETPWHYLKLISVAEMHARVERQYTIGQAGHGDRIHKGRTCTSDNCGFEYGIAYLHWRIDDRYGTKNMAMTAEEVEKLYADKGLAALSEDEGRVERTEAQGTDEPSLETTRPRRGQKE